MSETQAEVSASLPADRHRQPTNKSTEIGQLVQW
jgi:hypothetical protein